MRPQLRPPFGPIARAATVALLTVASVPLVAQGSAGQAGTGPGSIAGVVVDSLHGGPLVGAQVMAEGLDRLAVTDSSGQFRIDSVAAGHYRFGVFHPVLDSIGISVASPPLTLIAGQTLEVGFATPSATTLIALVCGTGATPLDTAFGSGPSTLIGRVLDAETDEPVAGAPISLVWFQMQVGRAGLHRTRLVRDTTSGKAGEFRFCHLPAGLQGVVRVARDTGSNDAVGRGFAMNRRLLGLVTLHVPTGAAAAAPPTARSAGAVLTGRVVGGDGAPVAGAQIKVVGSSRSTATGDSGQFTLRGLPTGTRTVSVLAVGWNPLEASVDLALRAPSRLDVSMGVKTAVLDAVIVTAKLKAGYDRVGFSERKLHGIGRYLDADEIDRRNASDFLDLMTGVPGIRRAYSRNGNSYLAGTRGGNGCVLYDLDGMQYRELAPGDIDQVVRPSEIGAIEVYQPSEGPIHVMNSPGGMGCVTVLIWTKARLGL